MLLKASKMPRRKSCKAILVICDLKCTLIFSEFAKSIPRKFSVRYDPYTESVEVITRQNKASIQKLTGDAKYLLDIFQDVTTK